MKLKGLLLLAKFIYQYQYFLRNRWLKAEENQYGEAMEYAIESTAVLLVWHQACTHLLLGL